MVDLTPLAKETANLRSRVDEASRDANEAEKAFEALSARSWKDNKEATSVRKEQDELLQKDAKTHQRILDLLDKVEKERDLKLGAKEKLTAVPLRSRRGCASSRGTPLAPGSINPS